jgi:hypothetical protein
MGHWLYLLFSLEASPGAAFFELDIILYDVLFTAVWKKNGQHRQRLSELNTARYKITALWYTTYLQ